MLIKKNVLIKKYIIDSICCCLRYCLNYVYQKLIYLVQYSENCRFVLKVLDRIIQSVILKLYIKYFLIFNSIYI